MERRRGRGIMIGGMALLLVFGCNNGMAELEKKSSFYESVVKIGQGFQEIFGNFGNVMGDALGFNAVKSDDNRSKVGEHFEKVKKGLEGTKNKLGELSSQISEAKNVDGSTIETVKNAIKGANEVFEKLISALTNLAEVAKGASSNKMGDAASAGAALAADKDGVGVIITEVKNIIGVSKKSGVVIEKGNDGGAVVANGDGPKVLAWKSSSWFR